MEALKALHKKNFDEGGSVKVVDGSKVEMCECLCWV